MKNFACGEFNLDLSDWKLFNYVLPAKYTLNQRGYVFWSLHRWYLICKFLHIADSNKWLTSTNKLSHIQFLYQISLLPQLCNTNVCFLKNCNTSKISHEIIFAIHQLVFRLVYNIIINYRFWRQFDTIILVTMMVHKWWNELKICEWQSR